MAAARAARAACLNDIKPDIEHTLLMDTGPALAYLTPGPCRFDPFCLMEISLQGRPSLLPGWSLEHCHCCMSFELAETRNLLAPCQRTHLLGLNLQYCELALRCCFVPCLPCWLLAVADPFSLSWVWTSWLSSAAPRDPLLQSCCSARCCLPVWRLCACKLV